MIRKLRRKFIATNMLLVSLVLLSVFGMQLFSSYRQTSGRVYQSAVQALEWAKHTASPGFEFRFPKAGGFETQDLPDLQRRPRNDLIPAFSVELSSDHQVLVLHTGPGVTVTRETAQALVDEVMNQTSGHGTLPGKNLFYLYDLDQHDRPFLAFADNSSVKASLRGQLTASLILFSLALLCFSLISWFLARSALHPVEKAWDQQRQFVADASHELKTPLAVILANTDIVLAHPDDPVAEQKKWLGYIKEEAQRMRALVEDMLFLAKSDAARLPIRPAQVWFSELVTGSLLPFESVAFEQGVTLVDRIAPDLSLTGDESQLRRLVVILLDNAVKYAGAGGTVTVTLEDAQTRLRLSVHNNGPAIPPEHLSHLFERFYRADTARDRTQGGYGLGLAIAQSITEAHGGKITVDSSEALGTTFTVTLPKK